MGKKAKKIIASAAAVTMSATMLPIMPTTAAAASSVSFDSETVMWTDRKIEDVLAQTGKYETVKEVQPNASNKTSADVQSPYAKSGNNLTEWAYSEFVWTNYYPIGNGRMAGMVAGGIDNEVIQINEDTCWDGGPYGTLQNENGDTVTNLEQTHAAAEINGVDMTSGSKPEGWRYYRGADADGNPAKIGAADAVVGDEDFRTNHPDFANKSISNQALNVDNSRTSAAVQDRYSLAGMVESNFLGNPTGQRAYKSFVEVYLDFNHENANASNYVKSLDMKTGIVTVEYDYNGKHYKRESFASYPDQVVVTHVESNEELNFTAELHTNHNTKDGYWSFEKISDNEVMVKAAVTDGNKDNNIGRINAINFEARMYLDGDGAFSVSEDNTTVTVDGTNSADIYVVGATNYVDYKTLDNAKPSRDCEYYMNNVKSRTYEQIKERHLDDFTAEFEKTSLSLDNSSSVSNYGDVPTEKRVRKDINGASGFTVGAESTLSRANSAGVKSTYSDGDNQLATLMFNYGKYLILAGARDGRRASGAGEIDIPESQPLNLTGKWNAAMSAGWNGKYTININTEMNYWAAQPLNIAESERTLIDVFGDLAQSGAITAANQYGIYNDRGDSTYQPGDPWVMHHNFDLWRGTQPIDNATAGLWPTGGVWLLDHAWQYYMFNKDEEYLAEVYPYMIGAAKFFTQFLVTDPQTGYLITAASCSPEQGSVQPGPAMDTQLVRNLYDTVRKASEILGKTEENAELLAKIDEQMPSEYFAAEDGKIAPNIIDSNGYIREWVRGDVEFDFSESSDPTAYKYQNITDPFTNTTVSINEHEASNSGGHRHCSHLWELYPGTHLSAYSDNADERKLFEAFEKTTSAKGVGDRSWGYAWRMALNARVLNGEAANTSLETLLTARTSPNLLTQHPNFQIDGNYGTTAAIIEMLIQSHDGAIDLLPAIPERWSSGSFKGINTREDAVVDLEWSEGKPTEAKIYAKADGDMRVRGKYMASAVVRDESGNQIKAVLNDDCNMLTFTAEEGKTYTITEFGSNVVEGSRTYKATDVKDFYASDNGSKPKADGDGVSIGYIYNRANVKIGYVVNDFDFDGLKSLKLNMKSVRYGNTYVSITADSPTGTEIANQIISTGDNALELKNLDSVSGTHDIYVLYVQNPYDGDAGHKYLGNAQDLTAFYSRTVEPTPEPDNYAYTIKSAYFGEDGKLNVIVEGEDTDAKLIIAAYTDKGGLSEVKTEAVKGDKTLSIDIEKPSNGSVKLSVWDGLDTMKPLCAVKLADASAPTTPPTAPPTATPTTVPTTAPTTAPTTTPTAAPAEQGAYIGETRYDTVTLAVAAAEEINPTSEENRVYIDITPGTYREQVRVTKPYITLRKKADTTGEVKLTWYYGLGTLYDSCNSSGYYDPSVIGDGESYGPKDWGPSLKVDKGATGFTAENITFENSYNCYYTQEELTDITGVDPDTNNSNFKRLEWIKEQIKNGVSDDEINAYLQSRKDITYGGVTSSPRERCAALHCSADKARFINCTIMSTQDTMGINSNRMYFKNCKIGGTTDYICGSATVVFDNCELYTNAGPKAAESATITAPANGADAEGYLFYNCKITGSDTATPGNLGRPWGAAPGPAAYYINTTINNAGKNSGNSSQYLISGAGWTDMSANKAEDARFGEYGSVYANGTTADLSGRIKGKVLTAWTMLRYNPYTFTKGSDGWDPAGVSSRYDGVNGVLDSTTIDTSDGNTNTVSLPKAPDGYEFYWESNSEFAQVSADQTKITLIRPAYGEDAIGATVKLYVRKVDDRSIGAEKSIAFSITATNDTENVFAVSGTVSMTSESAEDQTVTFEIKKGEAVIKTQAVTIAAGDVSQTYTIENIPVGEYTIYPAAKNSEYNVKTEPKSVTGQKGGSVTYDVAIQKMTSITVTDSDFDKMTPAVVSADGFTAGVYTASGSETANLGADNKVYRLTKDEGKTVAKNVGVSFNLKNMLPSGSTLDNTKTIRFSYDFLMETTAYMPSDNSYFDLATSMANAGNDAADPTRVVRWAVHKSWGQMNMYTAANTRVNGDNTQFDKNSAMANKWYRIRADIDLVNNTITTTLYNRDKLNSDGSMAVLNEKAFTIAEPDADGANINYPTDIDTANLYFNIYMDKKANTTNKMEYYFDNITLEYRDYE